MLKMQEMDSMGMFDKLLFAITTNMPDRKLPLAVTRVVSFIHTQDA